MTEFERLVLVICFSTLIGSLVSNIVVIIGDYIRRRKKK